jgi:3-isopropylmalate/(R)-2-methylmalate dehydratase small subunit
LIRTINKSIANHELRNMARFTTLTSRVIPLLVDNIDTDQIIPARFLKVTDKQGLGDNLFADWRYDESGRPKPDFPLNKEEHRGAGILLAGDNFGCGSSREHAPWALTGYGLHAVISTSFADIFCNNALKNGLLPVKVDKETYQDVLETLRTDPDAELHIDLASQTVSLPGGKRVLFPIDSFSKTCLVEGVDELGYIMRFNEQIVAYEKESAQ